MITGNKNGVTLPETMIACLILGLTFAGTLTGFLMAQKSVFFVNNRLAASHAARAGLEQLTSLEYYDAALTPGKHNTANGFYVVSESNGSKEINLTVQWVDQTRSATSTETLTTSISSAMHY